jgi:hypothetical protein
MYAHTRNALLLTLRDRVSVAITITVVRSSHYRAAASAL